MKIKKFIQDHERKILHAGINLLIMLMGLCSWYTCLSIALFFSIGKEISDKYLKHTYFDPRYLWADGIGISIGLFIRLLF